MSLRAKLLRPSTLVFVYAFLIQFIDTLYALQQIETPVVWDVLSRIGFVWVIWWWLRVDSRERGIQWILDLGMFLFLAWVVVLPFHLFKTRGWNAFVPILFFIVISLVAYVLAIVIWVFFIATIAQLSNLTSQLYQS